ncbi:hydrogenase maturation nickel metallochaperone HypA [Methylothermus subterraneus]
MHELSLAENLCQIIEDQAKQHGFTRVRKVVLAVGALSCVEPQALEFCFAEVTAQTLAQGASLEIVPIPGRGRCLRCLREQAMAELYALCAACHSPLEAVAGLEIQLKELIVE